MVARRFRDVGFTDSLLHSSLVDVREIRDVIPISAYIADQPPSMGIAAPVMSRPSGALKDAMTAATPSGDIRRPVGCLPASNTRSAAARSRFCVWRSGSSDASCTGVALVPGQTALHVMSYPVVSSATARVKPMSAVLMVTLTRPVRRPHESIYRGHVDDAPQLRAFIP